MRRTRIGRRLVVLALVLFLAALGMFAYYLTLPQYTGPRCWGFFDSPEMTLYAMPAPNGFAFDVTSTSHVKPLDCYTVMIYKDGVRLWPESQGAEEVVEGQIGTWPAGELLSFADTDGDGKLTRGDVFTLQWLDSN
ncbi:MAG: hypothetical protein V3V91_08255, partial [Thermoplasmata archaeon]